MSDPSAIQSDARPVSVVIPTWNGGPRFREVLASLAGQDLEGGFQLVVVDSGSTDGTREAALEAGAHVFQIEQRDFNHGRTRNLAIEKSSGDLVALLTQDAKPLGTDYLRRLLEPFADPAVAGAYARQLPRPDCDPLLAERLRAWSATRTEPETKVLAPDSPGDPAAARRRFDELPLMERYRACAFDNVASSIRRSAWEETPFPERTFGEDVAWAREILLSGGAVAFQPTATVEHSHRISIPREFRRIYCDHRNLYELFGLRNVPSWDTVFQGSRGQRRFYRELLAKADIGPLRRLLWRAYSIPYAFAETAAQFLGARSHWKTEESRFWRWADRKIRSGV